MRSLREVRELARLKDFKLRAGQFDGAVFLVHQDGSSFTFTGAIATRIDDFYVIFTEHHGYFVYPNDELRVIRIYGDIDHTKVDLLGPDSPDMPQDDDDDLP